MKELLFMISDFLKGKRIYTPLYKLINISLSVLITSNLFERFYFHYQLLDVSNYKLIYRFFVNGNFVPSLLLFLIIHLFFEIAISILFTGFISGTVDKWLQKIERFQFNEKLYVDFFDEADPKKIKLLVTDSPYFKYYLVFREFAMSLNRRRVETHLESKKKKLRNNFKLGFKILLYMVFCFISLSYFDWVLFTFSLLIILLALIFFLVGYILLEIAPSALRKFDTDILSLNHCLP